MVRSFATIVLVATVLAASGCARREYVGVAPRTPRAYCLRNVRVFDAPHATLLEGTRDVLVRDGWIAAIAPAGLKVSGVADVDGHGGTLLPGLIDAHVHTGAGYGPPWKLTLPAPEENLEAFLYAGVTTVLDLGNLTPQVFRQRDKIHAGAILGPRFYAAGPMMTAPGGHPVGLLRLALPW
jgi:imidazolonepropionase-like amidohydrolase